MRIHKIHIVHEIVIPFRKLPDLEYVNFVPCVRPSKPVKDMDSIFFISKFVQHFVVKVINFKDFKEFFNRRYQGLIIITWVSNFYDFVLRKKEKT